MDAADDSEKVLKRFDFLSRMFARERCERFERILSNKVLILAFVMPRLNPIRRDILKDVARAQEIAQNLSQFISLISLYDIFIILYNHLSSLITLSLSRVVLTYNICNAIY